MGKKKNKKNKAVEAEVIPFENDQNKEETEVKSNKFELIGKVVVGAGVGLLGVGAAVFGFMRGKGKKDAEVPDDQVAEELPDLDSEYPEEEE